MQVNGIIEQRDAQNITYILEEPNLFYQTGYKVMKFQEGKGIVRCNHLTHNGKDKLVYDISKYKTMVSLATILDGVAFLNVFVNLLDSIISVKNNGFMQYDNIDLSFDNIYVDCQRYKVYLIYVPVNLGIVNNDIGFFTDRFRYCANNYFESSLNVNDQIIKAIKTILSNNQYSFEEMKRLLMDKSLFNLNSRGNRPRNPGNFGNQRMPGLFGNIMKQDKLPAKGGLMNRGPMNGSPIKGGPMNGSPIKGGSMNGSPIKGGPIMGGPVNGGFAKGSSAKSGFVGDKARTSSEFVQDKSVSETMDISDLLKQIQKVTSNVQLSRNIEIDGIDSGRAKEVPKLNLGGTPGSSSKASEKKINDLTESGVIPNMRNFKKMPNAHFSKIEEDADLEHWKKKEQSNRNNPRKGGNNPRKKNDRSIEASIILVGNDDTGCLELIVDKEEFVIGKNFNVVDGFIPHNEGISRLHCKILSFNGEHFIVDLGSLNGTYVNGAKIPVKSQVPIVVGDVIGIANFEFRVEEI